MPQASGLQFTARIGGLPRDFFTVVGFKLTESLSSLFQGRLDLASTFSDIAASDVLEQPVDLVVWQGGEPLRRFTGVVNEFARGDAGHRRTRYEVIIQPPLWRLGLMHNSRIFQTQSTDSIVRTLLEERGIIDTTFDLKRTPEEREYCVQHRESDLSFLERLAAEEGWHFFYGYTGRYSHGDVNGEEQPALIIADHHGDAPKLAPAEYNTKAGGSTQQPAIFRFRYQERVRAASVAMKDYTFKNPAYALMHEHQADKLESQREDYQHYDYPGRFKVDASGQPFTESRLDALRNDASTATGKSNRPDFTAGAKTELTEHDNQNLNREWLFTSVTHKGEQPQALEEEGGSGPTTYHNDFQAIPADRNWRPNPSTINRQMMDGPQIAIVTGPAGEEIHCDEHGRVKVRFPWDRYSKNDEHSSAWLRVSQGWAGGQYGFMALPRIGHEVIVSFLDGDPDQPIITGRTYHATNTPPYALPEHKTRTTLKTQTHKGEGSNELRFEDEADKEQIYIHAQKDLDLLTENNRTEVVKNDSHRTVENNNFSHIKANQHSTVDGEKRESVGGDCSQNIGGTFHQKSGSGTLCEAGTEVHHKAGTKVVLDAGAELTISAGGSLLKLDPSGVTLSGPGIKINSGGSPGSGSGQGVVMTEMPQTLEAKKDSKVAPAQVADVDQRALVDGSAGQGSGVNDLTNPMSPALTESETAEQDIKTIQLLPLRYGRVEQSPVGSEAGLPDELTSRPIGYRLLRNGYLYILDPDDDTLHEYRHQDGQLTGHNGGKLEYPGQHTLYVSFSEVAWTDRKRAQVFESEADCDAFMQRVDLASASVERGGRSVLTSSQASEWVAECAEQPSEGETESSPYHWEHHPYFQHKDFASVAGQYGVTNPEESLCLVVRDDVGIMLDLAQHQDEIVDQIETWAETGHNERDYTLGTWIESMTLLTEDSLSDQMAALDDPASRLMKRDIDDLPEPAQSDTRRALLEALNETRIDQRPGPNDPDLPPDVKAEVEALRAQVSRTNAFGIHMKMQAVVDNWSLKALCRRNGADSSFVDKHLEALRDLESEHRESLRNALTGAGFGDRGINDLINRPDMDAFMQAQRKQLSGWHAELDAITDDRATLLCDARYHRAAWYFDPLDEAQLDAALTLEYACLKDLCRNDDAAERVLAWLNDRPEYSRPLFYTRPLSEQSAGSDLMTAYAGLLDSGYDLVEKAKEKAQQLSNAEAASGNVPNLNQLSETFQQQAAAVGDTLSPALAIGIARSMEALQQGIDRQQMPDLDELFRDLPYFFKSRMLDAINSGNAEFRLSSADELERFRQNVKRLIALKKRTTELSDRHEKAKTRSGHKSVEAQQAVQEFKATRDEHREVGKRLAAALSPIEESDTGLKLVPAETGRAGLALILPAAQHQEVGRLMKHYREGLATASRANLFGDGIGALVFVVQVVNLWNVASEFASQAKDSRDWSGLTGSISATGAAGFLCAQGLADTVLSARATVLANAWQGNSLTTVQVHMGKLHVGLGIFAYGFGAFASAFALYEHRGRWLDASAQGNRVAQTGAAMAMAGSGGLVATNLHGLNQTRLAARSVWRSAANDRVAAWAIAGTRLSALFARLNLFGAIFTVMELGGTWLFNRPNLDRRDKWLLSTPWSSEPQDHAERSLDDYEQALAKLGDSLTLERAPSADEACERARLTLNCFSLTPDSIITPLASKAYQRVSIAAWRIQPARPGMLNRAPETWVRASGPVLKSLVVNDDVEHLQFEFDVPHHQKTQYKLMTRTFALAVKLETRQPDGQYTSEVFMLKQEPDSPATVTPVREAPKDDVIWRRIRLPLTELDIYE